MTGWDLRREKFYWGDGTYSTRKDLIACHRLQLIRPTSPVFGVPRHREGG